MSNWEYHAAYYIQSACCEVTCECGEILFVRYEGIFDTGDFGDVETCPSCGRQYRVAYNGDVHRREP